MTEGQQLRRGRVDSAERLAEQLANVLTPSSAIVCVGNQLRGDDGAGAAVAGKLGADMPWRVFDTQTAPESFLMKIAAGKPESVVLIDALDFGAAPGAIELFEPDRIEGASPSTHGPAPLAFLDVLKMIHPCRCAVLGIQAQHVDFGNPMGEPVKAAVSRIVQAFRTLADRTSPSPPQ